jgi:hypothetical protein
LQCALQQGVDRLGGGDADGAVGGQRVVRGEQTCLDGGLAQQFDARTLA